MGEITNHSYASLSVAAIVSESASRFGDRTALQIGNEEISYAQLWDQIRCYAGALGDLGVGPEDVVAVLIPNVPDFVRTYYAVLSLGAIVAPIHALLKADEIEYILRDSGAKLIVSAAALLAEGQSGAAQAGVPLVSVMADGSVTNVPRLEDLARDADPIVSFLPRAAADTATILYTSGTTGKPKGAMGSHLALIEQTSVLLLSTFDLNQNDVVLGGLPLFHTFGQTCTLNTALRAGAKVVLLPKFEATVALRTLIDTRCTIMMGVPTMYIALLEAAKATPDRPQLRYAISGGASLPVAVIEKFRTEFAAEIYEGYGLTETAPVATFNHIGALPRVGSIGTPIWGVDVEIANAEIEDRIELLGRGQLGELVIRGHNLMNGYLNLPDESARAVVDGWFRTGDLGTKDQDDYLRIVDRKKDMILRNGYNVYPREVEEVLATHPVVSTSAVFGVPHPVHGQEVVACVVAAAGATLEPEELVDFVRTRIAAFKYPRRVFLVPALPLGPSGKVLKRELATTYAGEFTSPDEAAVNP